MAAWSGLPARRTVPVIGSSRATALSGHSGRPAFRQLSLTRLRALRPSRSPPRAELLSEPLFELAKGGVGNLEVSGADPDSRPRSVIAVKVRSPGGHEIVGAGKGD